MHYLLVKGIFFMLAIGHLFFNVWLGVIRNCRQNCLY